MQYIIIRINLEKDWVDIIGFAPDYLTALDKWERGCFIMSEAEYINRSDEEIIEQYKRSCAAANRV